MREGQFIKLNKERWETYQYLPTDDPDELARRFAYLVDDLAYARTFYTNSNTVRYINSMAADIYLSIYKNKTQSRRRLLTFWTTELPLLMFKYRKILLCSFLLFLFFYLLGFAAAAIEPDFTRSILSSEYVEMTEENIARGDPFGVYKDQQPFLMFLRIMWNNILVSLKVFGFGIFFGLGTLYFLFRNALMVGVFEYLFYQHHLGKEFFLVVFVHGVLELSGIVVAACAGFILGYALLFPRTYTRVQSLRRAAPDAVKIILGLIPVFLIAAFFESYVTRHTEMPVWMSVSILTVSLGFVLFYFVVYPRYLFKQTMKRFGK